MTFSQSIGFQPGSLSPAFFVRQNVHGPVNATGILFAADPSRVWFSVSLSAGFGELWISPFQMPAPSQGFLIAEPLQPTAIFTYRDIGPIIGYEWFFHDPFLIAQFSTLEIGYNPDLIHGTTKEQENVLQRHRDRPEGEERLEDEDDRDDFGSTIKPQSAEIVDDSVGPAGGNGHL